MVCFWGLKIHRSLIFTKFTPGIKEVKTKKGLHLLLSCHAAELRSEPLIPNILRSHAGHELGWKCTHIICYTYYTEIVCKFR